MGTNINQSVRKHGFHPDSQSQIFATNILSNLPDLILCINETGIITFCNRTAEMNIPGILAGKNYFDFICEEDREKVKKLHEESFTDHEPAIYEFKGNNTEKWHCASLVYYEEYRQIIVSIRDITTHRHTEAGIIFMEDFAIKLIDSAQTIILLLDNEGKIMSYNPFMEEISGYKLEEVKGKSWFSTFIPDYEKVRIKNVFKETLKSPLHGNVNPILTKSGETRIIEWHGKKFSNNEGKSIGLLSVGIDITEKVKAEEALRQSESRLAFSMKLAGIAIWEYHIENKIFILNDQFFSLFKIDENKRRKYKITADTYLNRFLYAEDRAVYRKIIKDAEQGKLLEEMTDLRHPFKFGNGEKGFIAVHIFSIRNSEGEITGMVGATQDITGHIKAEEDLRLSKNQLLIAQKMAKLGYWEYDAINNLFHFDDNFYSLFRTTAEREGSYIMTPENYARRFVHPEDIDLVRKEVDYVLGYSGPELTRHLEHRVVFADGTTGYISVQYFIVRDKQGKTIRTFGANQDITQHKETEIMLAQQNERYYSVNKKLNESLKKLTVMNRELKEAKVKAEESDLLKSAFLANMSHEIRTPMNGIIGFSKMLSKPNLSDDRKRYYTDIINDMCRQLLNLINDIIDISKIETGQVKLRITKTNINDLFLHLFSYYKPLAEKNNINLYLKKSLSDDESIIETDYTKLRQIMDNLLGNALKFTHEGYVKFGYSIKRNSLVFFVEDTGIGIPEKLQKVIFERFSQVQTVSDKFYSGTGLGLAISKAFVEKMGGEISVKSSPGKGSLFSFTIPYSAAGKESNRLNSDHPEIRMKRKKILVVEDEDYNYLYLEEVLIETKAEILHAKSGVEALELCNKHPDINLILMDIKLPDFNGFEVLKRVRTIMPSVPVIAQTAYALSGDKEIALEMGFDDYLSKPIDDVELLNKINIFLNKTA